MDRAARLGLHHRSDLEIQETPKDVVLLPAEHRPSLVGKNPRGLRRRSSGIERDLTDASKT